MKLHIYLSIIGADVTITTTLLTTAFNLANHYLDYKEMKRLRAKMKDPGKR